MLEWTGERFLPWLEQSTIAYEHLHRYAYAATMVKDKRVLDLAFGEGYGSKMLATSAASVVGIDIDENAVRHANTKYGSKTLQFIPGSITAVPITDDHSFDVIVCFEAIEHIEDQEKLLSEVKRLLRPAGVFIVSTPNKVVYDHESEDDNPFHVKELEFDEFEQLLTRHFRNIQFLGQRIHPVSSIWPIGSQTSASLQEFVLEKGEAEFRFTSNERRVALYFIAIATDSPALLPQPASVLIDSSDSLLKEKDKEIQASLEAVHWREEQVNDRERTIASLEEAIKWHQGRIQELTEGLDWTRSRIGELEKTIASHEQALEWRAHQVEDLGTQNAILQTTLQSTQRQLTLTGEQLEAIHASSGWKMILKVRHIRDIMFPAGSSRRKIFEGFIGLLKSRA